MLGRALRMAFWVLYDHVGKLILASMVWSLMVGIPLVLSYTAALTGDLGLRAFIGWPALLLTLVVTGPIATAGLAHMAKELIETRDGSVRTMFGGMRLYARRASAIGAIYVVVVACLATSAWFYAAKLQGTAPMLGYILSALALWCLAFVLLTALLVVPTLVQKKASAIQTVKLVAMIVLDNPLFSLGLTVQVVALSVMLLLPPLAFCLYGATIAVLTSTAYEQLARKYARLARQAESGGNSNHTKRLSALGAQKEPVEDDEDDDYLNRGFRDFLFPWKG